MTDYIPITESETDPGAPATSELAKKWRDNPLAIAEGSVGAPRVMGSAINIGSTTEELSGNATGAIIVLPDARFLSISYRASANSTSATSAGAAQVRFSNDGGTSWSSWIDLAYAANNSSTTNNSIAKIDRVSGLNYGQGPSGVGITNINSLQFRTTAGTSASASLKALVETYGTTD